ANISLLRPLKPNETFDVSEILPMAPFTGAEMFGRLMSIAGNMKNQELKNVCQNLLETNKSRLLTIPGGKSMHHNVIGGLLYHMLRMAESGLALAKIYPEINPDLIAAGAIVHDIGKLEEYETEPSGMIRDYTAAGDLLSHNILGILSLEQACKKTNASKETLLALSHMIESHHGAPERGSAIRPMFLEADLLHHLDMIDSRIWIFNREQEKLEPGEVSRPIKAIDGPVYRPF
ncbi:MAG: HD domain-containing protein, partial [Erysipelotrichaceae bacterium]|nr:HD domain-containing protein [Erysipelotrichaceae bacterium]